MIVREYAGHNPQNRDKKPSYIGQESCKVRTATGGVGSKLALAYSYLVVILIVIFYECVFLVMELIVIQFEFLFIARRKEAVEKVYPGLVDVIRTK